MLTAAQVEQYVTNDEDDIRDERLLDIKRPLLSFAVIACWSLQTYAHQASKPQKWIELVRDVSGLVDFAAETCQKGSVEDAEVKPIVMELLFALLVIFETLRQCEPGAFVARQIEYKYNRSLRQLMKKDVEETRERLKAAVVTEVVALAVYQLDKQRALFVASGSVASQEASASEASPAISRLPSAVRRANWHLLD